MCHIFKISAFQGMTVAGRMSPFFPLGTPTTTRQHAVLHNDMYCSVYSIQDDLPLVVGHRLEYVVNPRPVSISGGSKAVLLDPNLGRQVSG